MLFRSDKSMNNTNTNNSPTSVISTCVSISDDAIMAEDTFIMAPLMSMNINDDESEDGDILEVME